MEKFDLAPAEWNIMECLWERAPQTGRELTEQLEASMGWSRSTTLPLLTFLDRVYQGSLSMKVSAMTRRQAISKEEIDELYELLRQMEEGTK